jgi:hypothetical protein
MRSMLSIKSKTVKIILWTTSIKDFMNKIQKKDLVLSGGKILFILDILPTKKAIQIKLP